MFSFINGNFPNDLYNNFLYFLGLRLLQVVVLTVSLMFLEQPITNIFCERRRILFTSEHSGHVFCFLFHVLIFLFLQNRISSNNLDYSFFLMAKFSSRLGGCRGSNMGVVPAFMMGRRAICQKSLSTLYNEGRNSRRC